MKNNYYLVVNDKSLSAKHYIKKIEFKKYSVSVDYTLSKSEALILDCIKAYNLLVILECEMMSKYIVEEAK